MALVHVSHDLWTIHEASAQQQASPGPGCCRRPNSLAERQVVQINATLVARTQTVKYLYPPGNDLLWNISISAPAGSAWDTLGGWQRACTAQNNG